VLLLTTTLLNVLNKIYGENSLWARVIFFIMKINLFKNA